MILDRLRRLQRRRLGALAVVVVAGAVGCSSSGSPSDGSESDSSDSSVVAARAIEEFGERYTGSVSQPDAVQIPASLEIDAIQDELEMDMALVRSPDPNQAYWTLESVRDLGDYWVAQMSSTDGPDFFSGPLYFVIGDNGDAVRVEAEDVGETITTSVS